MTCPLVPLVTFVAILFSYCYTHRTVGNISLIIHGQSPRSSLNQLDANISLADSWLMLGPFRCGTREAIWGADPLEYSGGFSNLSYEPYAFYNSALAIDGIVKWHRIKADLSTSTSEQANAHFNASFPDYDWRRLQSVYGWPALQYQAWMRGHLGLAQPPAAAEGGNWTVALYASGILEFSIDGKRHFGGDFYSYSNTPVIMNLPPGEHAIDIRLIRDVRASGGTGDPTISAKFRAEIRHEPITIDNRSVLVPEISQGKLGSKWGSINVQSNSAENIEVLSISTRDEHQYDLTMERPLQISAYQTRPVVFRIVSTSPLVAVVCAHITYRIQGQDDVYLESSPFCFHMVERSLLEAHKLTYLHPSKIVSYALLRPPPLHLSCSNSQGHTLLPIIIGLHGAGLRADSAQVREMLNGAYGVCAWMLFPSGVTSWSSDDWHNWGDGDIQAAVNAIPHWAEEVGWQGSHVSLNDWIVVGHSNGGQGAWYLATHYPDKVIAAAPVSGYSSIENYIPYNMWQESEAIVTYVLENSRSSFRHELLLGNVAGIPILQQHGSDDDNVPVYHSRLLHELLDRTEWPSKYSELPGKNHWFDGVLTTPGLIQFYNENASPSPAVKVPPIFTMSIPSSGHMASRCGIHVDQLQSPDANGRIEVIRDLAGNNSWSLRTRNIHRFHLTNEIYLMDPPLSLVLDDSYTFQVDPDQYNNTWYSKDSWGRWTVSHESSWKSLTQRHGRQLGVIDAILRTEGSFKINICSQETYAVALQISRNLVQYFGADSQLSSQCYDWNASVVEPDQEGGAGNLITLAVGPDLPPSQLMGYPIQIVRDRVMLSKPCCHNARRDMQTEHFERYEYAVENHMGAIFLRPLENEGLELVVWGADLPGLEQAARLVPTLTGVGQPDFMILSDSCRWKGSAGIHAAGYFDKDWQISPVSYISTDPTVRTPRRTWQ